MSAVSNVALISIQTVHANNIYAGTKRAELRKSFSSDIRLLFLYETLPVAAVTGLVIVQRSERMSVSEIIDCANRLGVAPENTKAYFGGRQNGWVIEIAYAVRFKAPITLDRLVALDHYFCAPQAFTYLDKFNALTQTLFRASISKLSTRLRFRSISKPGLLELSDLIMFSVANEYEDIDDDFIQQISNSATGQNGAFSTNLKVVLEAWIGTARIGYTVLTEKCHGSWKSGPTVILPGFRGIGLGQAFRDKIASYCKTRGARSLYCTCPASSRVVLSYLLASGFQLQARLKHHLARDRDELVLSRHFRDTTNLMPITRRRSDSKIAKYSSARIEIGDHRCARVIEAFINQMPFWYFAPPDAMEGNIMAGLRSYNTDQIVYSQKPRILFSCDDGNMRARAIALCTAKRSKMLKLNIVGTTRDLRIWNSLLKIVLRDTVAYRRLYVTVPITQEEVLVALGRCGFAYEGQLLDPFGSGLDHVCMGLLR